MKNQTKSTKLTTTTTESPEVVYEYVYEYVYDYYDYYDGPLTIDYDLLLEITYHIWRVDIYLQYVGILVNIFHLMVLLRKELRSNFIFTLMIGICIFDLTKFVLMKFREITSDIYKQDGCLASPNLIFTYVDFILMVITYAAQRSSVYSGLTMALFRLFSITFPMSLRIRNFQKPRNAWILVAVIGILCGMFDVSHHWHHHLEEFQYEKEDCSGRRVKKNTTYYQFTYSEEYYDFQTLYDKIEGFSRIFTCLAYLLITVTLILKLHGIRRQRGNANASQRSEEKYGEVRMMNSLKLTFRTNNTTMIVASVAALFCFSETYFGSYFILRNFWFTRNRDVQYTIARIVFIRDTLFIVSSSFHCLIMIFLSSQYKQSLKKMFTFKWKLAVVPRENSDFKTRTVNSITR